MLEFNRDSRFKGITGVGQSIVVIDTGIDLNHPGFGPDLNKDGISDRIVRKDLDFTRQRDGTVEDTTGHGTATAGIAATIAPGVKIIPIQVSLVGDIREAIKWVIANEDKYNITAVTASLSIGGNETGNYINAQFGHYPLLYREFSNLYNAGIPTTVAAGNDYKAYLKPGVQTLASYWSNNAVMSVKSNGLTQGSSLADSSQRRKDALGAPGVGIEVFKKDGLTYIGAGTSLATPFVASSLQLLQGVSTQYLGRELTPGELMSITRSTGDLIGNSGYKQINVFKAADAVWKLGQTNRPIANSNAQSINMIPITSSIDLNAPLVPVDTNAHSVGL